MKDKMGNRVAKDVKDVKDVCKGTTCPSRQRITRKTWICKHHNLGTEYPQLLNEWNDLSKAESFPSNSRAIVQWKCSEGHVWSVSIKSRVQGGACPRCGESRGERRIRLYLESKHVVYEEQKKFSDLRYKRPLAFDFYLPKYNLAVEFDGKQHSQPVAYFGGEKSYLEGVTRDEIKNTYCMVQEINLLRITHREYDQTEELLEQELRRLAPRSCVLL